ncbi:MAG: hypothetical protein U9P42_02210 [Candidatus Fermentibacteria bacterium]|nr:hypothetical protein [Candidatus Fermentibacteria bacterium]
MAASENARIQRLINSAEELIQKGDRQKALTDLHKALDIDSGNRSVKKRILEIEREVLAMRNFKKTRDSRTHKTGNSVSSGDFVDECITRSEDAFREGDEVRALQELERARRHDPDNKLVRRKIVTVRRQIKTDNLYDLALTKLADDDVVTAVKNARIIFNTWPGAPVLSDLLNKLEEFKPQDDQLAGEEIEEIEDLEDEDLEEVVEDKDSTVPAPEKEKTSPADAAISSIRGKISRSDFSSALTEAKEARIKHPKNKTIKELVERLEKLSGKKKPAVVPVVKEEKPEDKPAGKKKKPVGLIIAALVAAILVVVFVVVKPFGGDGQEPDTVPVVEEVFQPYSVSFTVDSVETYSN